MEPISSTDRKVPIIRNWLALTSKLDLYNMTDYIKKFCGEGLNKFSAETLGWLAILFIHGATIPALMALMAGITDNPPPVDIVLMVWAGLLLMFAKAAVQRDMLSIFTIGIGFVVQAVMMILIFFK